MWAMSMWAYLGKSLLMGRIRENMLFCEKQQSSKLDFNDKIFVYKSIIESKNKMF